MMSEDVTPDLLISEIGLTQRLNGYSPSTVLNLDQLALDGVSAAKETEPAAPDDFCYIYFASGSTGRPKGIAGRLKGIDHFIQWQIETLNLGKNDRVSQLLPLSFDGSLRDIFVPLCAGGTIGVPEHNELVTDAKELVAWLDREQISLIHCVPTLFRAILNEDRKPMPGARALIVDEEGRVCPPGVIGKIYIRTPYRSHGYYKQPELTAEVFISNPFSNDPNDIVYRTGDLGRVLDDGNIELLGRKDQQVKIRGFELATYIDSAAPESTVLLPPIEDTEILSALHQS